MRDCGADTFSLKTSIRSQIKNSTVLFCGGNPLAVVPVAFEDALKVIDGARNKHLLLGNGFSIALKPDIFSYSSLFENADFSSAPQIKALFKTLGTQDFEIAIRHLQDTAKVLTVYQPDLKELLQKLAKDAAAIKDALVSAVAKRHPDRPYDITKEQCVACRSFLQRFNHIYTLNYDVLLYWTLMQDEVDEIDLRPDDGFRHPEGDPDLPYVSWQEAQSSTVHYLHGALHLFDQGTEIIKYTWSKTDKAIVDQIREALDDDKYPLFIAEGSSDSKVERILHNAYLHKALRSFEASCGPLNNAIVVFGHSLATNDQHILRCISAGGTANLLIGLYGDPTSQANKTAIARADEPVALRTKLRGERVPLNVTFYKAETAKVWG
jgi:hypothetical protein